MSRNSLFVLLLAMGVVLAVEANHAAGAAGPQARTDKAQAKTKTAEKAQANREVAHVRTEGAQAKIEAAQVRTELTQAKKGAAHDGTEHTPATTGEAQGQVEEAAPSKEDQKLTSVPGGSALGMSILGNQEAPKSLVIVPWKSSELGRSPGISTMLDDSKQPVDKEVFLRGLRYYEIRSGRKR